MIMKLSTKIISFFIVVLILSGLLGCRRQGCTSSDGINFDPEAKSDDGTCLFPGELFAGIYSFNDTITRKFNTFPDSTHSLFRTDTFVLYFLDNKVVSWRDYSSCDTIKCDVTASNLNIQTGYNCNGLWDNFTLVRNNNELTYTYRIGFGGIVTDEVKGRANKLP